MPSSSSSLENDDYYQNMRLSELMLNDDASTSAMSDDSVRTLNNPSAKSNSSTSAPKIVDDTYENLDYFSLAKIVRRYKLHNRCSGKYLQIYLKEVNARGTPNSPLVDLRVETDTYGSRIRIQSEKFNKYLCLNRRNRTTTKYNGRNLRCVFVEHISDNHYTELESAAVPGLYLGFNKHGRFINPKRYHKKRTCFQYIKAERMSSHIEAFQRRPGHPTTGKLAPSLTFLRNFSKPAAAYRNANGHNRTKLRHQHKNHWRRRHRRHRHEINIRHLGGIS